VDGFGADLYPQAVAVDQAGNVGRRGIIVSGGSAAALAALELEALKASQLGGGRNGGAAAGIFVGGGGRQGSGVGSGASSQAAEIINGGNGQGAQIINEGNGQSGEDVSGQGSGEAVTANVGVGSAEGSSSEVIGAAVG